MILLLNVKITNERNVHFYRRYTANHYPNDNRVDIFKYSLASHAVMNPLITKYVFFIEFGEDVIHRKDEIISYIINLFPADKLILNFNRMNYVNDWRSTCIPILDGIDDDIIYWAGNDDHIFLDSNLDTIKEGIELLKEEKDPMSFVYYSHYPEQIRLAKHLNAKLTKNKYFVEYDWNTYDAIQIVSKERFKSYWSDASSETYLNELLFKSDVLIFSRPWFVTKCYTPTKELVRHFDGYGHVHNMNNLVPSLVIPHGFFDNNIKIRYGFNNRIDDYVNINPAAAHLYSEQVFGVDYKWCLEDIPLFWKDRISSIETNENIDENELILYRNKYVIDMGNIPIRNAYANDMNADSTDTGWFINNMITK